MIKSVKGNYDIEPLHIIEKAEEIKDVDLVITAVKGYHIQGALNDLKALVDKGAKVVPLLNGMEHIEILQRELGKENVLGGLAFIIATLNEKGHVVHTSEQHRLVFGPLDPSQKRICDMFQTIIQKANVQAEYSDDIHQALWEKYVFITAFSGITTATNMPIGPIRRMKETFAVYEDLVNEMAELSRAYGYPLTDEKRKGIIDTVFQLPEESTSSMHQDRRKGLALEVEHLQGGALRMAERKGLKLPVLKTIYGVIKLLENE